MYRIYEVPVPGKDYSFEFCIETTEYSKERKGIDLVRVGSDHYAWEYECDCVGEDDGTYMDIQVSVKDGFLRLTLEVTAPSKKFGYVIESSDFLQSELKWSGTYVSPEYLDPEDIACTGYCIFNDKRYPLKVDVMRRLLSILRL